MTRLRPGQDASPLELDLIIGTKWRLAEQNDNAHPWRMIVVYRGLHCPVCEAQLKELSGMLCDFIDAGVTVVSASADSHERARKAYDEWGLDKLPVAHDVPEDLAERFGLYVSKGISDEEPERFFEPATLLFRGSTFHAAWVQSLPFVRPGLSDILSSIRWIGENEYPARGRAVAA
jgi:peroxiredoxin